MRNILYIWSGLKYLLVCSAAIGVLILIMLGLGFLIANTVIFGKVVTVIVCVCALAWLLGWIDSGMGIWE